MTLVVGTAGHIDHGKTTLLRALTGIDADRLPEERRRGMTIDIGYAHLDLEDGASIDFVDVPGHDGLVGNMLVGAGEMDAAMLVVAADDGPRAQTLEHLELLDGLGIRHALAVVTKADVAGIDRATEVAVAVERLLAMTTLAGARVLVASGVTGDGIGAVRAALIDVRSRAVVPGPVDGARLAIDRVFSVRGRGVVVTGTLRGTLALGDTLRVVTDGVEVRVRGLQIHNREVDRSAGGRTALALGGVGAEDLSRGDVLVRGAGGDVAATRRLLVALRSPVAWPGHRPTTPPRVGETLRLHLGTSKADARVRSIGADPTFRVLALDRPIAAAPGDGFVLRRSAPAGTAAAGNVLDVDPPRGPSRRRATPERLTALTATPSDPAPRLDLHGALVTGTTAAVAPDVRTSLDAAARHAVDAHHIADPGSAGLPMGDLRSIVARTARRLVALDVDQAATIADATVAGLMSAGTLARDGDRVRDPARVAGPPPELAAAMDRLEAALSVAAPPPLAEAAQIAGCPSEGIAALARAGRIIRLETDLAWATTTYHRLAATALAAARRGPLSPAAFRDATGSSRRYALAILEDLDRRGVLSRTPDGHVPGPRAPRP